MGNLGVGKQRVLVTGHRGYIGAHLTALLVGSGYDVVGLDSNLYAGCRYGRTALPLAGHDMDIRDVTPDVFVGVYAVLHLAGLSNDPLGDIDPAMTREINTEGTIRLAQIAKAAGVRRFLFSSSCSNYGAGLNDWLTEESPVNPLTPYAISKVQSEDLLSELADDGFSPVYLRSATAYGMSPFLRFDLVVNNLTAWAVATGQVRLKSDGSAWRPLVHVQDIAEAFLTVLKTDRGGVHDQAYNVGRSDECFQIRKVAEIVQEEISGTDITFARESCPDDRTYRVDFSKIAGLGFRPKWTVRAGVRELRDAFTRFGLRLEEFEGPTYQRVAHILARLRNGSLDATLRASRLAAE